MAQREPPLTATPLLDEELTPPLDGIVPDEVDEFDELELELSESEELDESLAPLVDVVAADVGVVVPGMVAALTAAKTPTPATAATEAPTVICCRRRSAWSRDRARVAFEGSMPDTLRYSAEPCLKVGCEVPEKRSEGGGYTLFEFNGARRSWSRRVMPVLNQNSDEPAPVAQWRRARAGRTESKSNEPAPVAQWIEQDGPNVKVGGSIPSGGAFLSRCKISY